MRAPDPSIWSSAMLRVVPKAGLLTSWWVLFSLDKLRFAVLAQPKQHGGKRTKGLRKVVSKAWHVPSAVCA